MRELTGRVAVVTGAASGIGRCLAERCAAEGMRVVLADVEPEALEAAAARLRARGAEVLAVRTDVSRSEEVEALAAAALEAFGAVHLLCNNAGVGVGTSVWETSLEDWRWVLGVNLWGAIHGVRAFVPLMLRQAADCHIVNTASIQGLLTHHPLSSSYQVSKHAVVALSEQLHHELAQIKARIGVSVLCPGWVRTQIGVSGRNRPPAALAAPTGDFSPAYEAALERCIVALQNGDAPEAVADGVIEAVREGRFYILPHRQWLDAVRARLEGILDGRAPGRAEP